MRTFHTSILEFILQMCNTEIFAEAASLPILLVFYHDDISNFVAGKAYEVSYISE